MGLPSTITHKYLLLRQPLAQQESSKAKSDARLKNQGLPRMAHSLRVLSRAGLTAGQAQHRDTLAKRLTDKKKRPRLAVVRESCRA